MVASKTTDGAQESSINWREWRGDPHGDYRFVRITDIGENGKLSDSDTKFVAANDASSEFLLMRGDLLMARTGGTYAKTALIVEDMRAVFASFLIRIRVDQQVLVPSYYWHFAQSSSYWAQAQKMVTRGGQPQFNANVARNILLPIPSLAEQRRIVNILDQLDTLVNDLSIGLPAELNARRRQYQHYRDRLLTFTEVA